MAPSALEAQSAGGRGNVLSRTGAAIYPEGLSAVLRPVAWLRPRNQAESRFWIANGIALALLGAAWAVGLVESAALGRTAEHRVIEQPVVALVHFLGIPHYVLAFFFLLGSRHNRMPGARMRIGLGFLLGVVLCAAYAAAGGPPFPGSSAHIVDLRSGLLAVVLFACFVLHEIRDQGAFVSRCEDGAPRSLLWAVVMFGCAAVAVLAWSAAVLGVNAQAQALLPFDLAPVGRVVAAILPILALTLAVRRALRTAAERESLSHHVLWQRLSPYIRMVALVIGVILVGAAITGRVYWVVLTHFMVWYLFSTAAFDADRGDELSGDWRTWVGSRFRSVHWAMVGALVAASLVWKYGFDQASGIPFLLSDGAFVNWTIIHLSSSWVNRSS